MKSNTGIGVGELMNDLPWRCGQDGTVLGLLSLFHEHSRID